MNVHIFSTEEGKISVISSDGVRGVIHAMFIMFQSLSKEQQERVIEKLKEEVKQ